MNVLPDEVYTAEQVRALDRIAIHDYQQDDLMQRAGRAVFQHAVASWQEASHWLIICGKGNNAGDGLVVAQLAQQAGLSVMIIALVEPDSWTGEPLREWQRCQSLGIPLVSWKDTEQAIADFAPELIIDAILGTGLTSSIQGDYLSAIDWVNQQMLPVLSIDIPSGLHADTGKVMGVAVMACHTLTFIGLKLGLFIADGLNQVGELYFDDLQVPEAVYNQVPSELRRLDMHEIRHFLGPRPRDAHKGLFGHVLLVGGGPGMAGAVCLAATAALRAGAGLVSVLTHEDNRTVVHASTPEVMCYSYRDQKALDKLAERVTVLAIGPGLGLSPWAEQVFHWALALNKPMVMDADALNWLARLGTSRLASPCILTPHPGEAGRLLERPTASIQEDRLKALQDLVVRYQATCILKGAGSLVMGLETPVYLCSAGNPGMSSAGMGDVLTGVTVALLAQGLSLIDSARLAVLIHASAGDIAAIEGERGLMASDLFQPIRECVNILND